MEEVWGGSVLRWAVAVGRSMVVGCKCRCLDSVLKVGCPWGGRPRLVRPAGVLGSSAGVGASWG